MDTKPIILSEPIVVADLPLPPEDAALLEKDLRSRRLTRVERTFLMDDVKLSHHYAGHYIIGSVSPRGLLIHAIDLDDPDVIHEFHQSLEAQGYNRVVFLYPEPWKVQVSRIG